MNVGKMWKKWEGLLLFWLGHHYLLMNMNINNSGLTAVSAKIISTTSTPTSTPTTPTNTNTIKTGTTTSCHRIYSLHSSLNNLTASDFNSSNVVTYCYNRTMYGNGVENDSAICFNNLVKCIQPHQNNFPSTPSAGKISGTLCITYDRRICVHTSNENEFSHQLYLRHVGQICTKSKIQTSHITCGKSFCRSHSLCLSLMDSAYRSTVEPNCVCQLGYMGSTCKDIDFTQFHFDADEIFNFDKKLVEVLQKYKTKDKWIVGITLMGLLSVAFCTVFAILACCVYMFIQKSVITMHSLAVQHSLRIQHRENRTNANGLNLCCCPRNNGSQIDFELQDITNAI